MQDFISDLSEHDLRKLHALAQLIKLKPTELLQNTQNHIPIFPQQTPSLQNVQTLNNQNHIPIFPQQTQSLQNVQSLNNQNNKLHALAQLIKLKPPELLQNNQNHIPTFPQQTQSLQNVQTLNNQNNIPIFPQQTPSLQNVQTLNNQNNISIFPQQTPSLQNVQTLNNQNNIPTFQQQTPSLQNVQTLNNQNNIPTFQQQTHSLQNLQTLPPQNLFLPSFPVSDGSHKSQNFEIPQNQQNQRNVNNQFSQNGTILQNNQNLLSFAQNTQAPQSVQNLQLFQNAHIFQNLHSPQNLQVLQNPQYIQNSQTHKVTQILQYTQNLLYTQNSPISQILPHQRLQNLHEGSQIPQYSLNPLPTCTHDNQNPNSSNSNPQNFQSDKNDENTQNDHNDQNSQNNQNAHNEIQQQILDDDLCDLPSGLIHQDQSATTFLEISTGANSGSSEPHTDATSRTTTNTQDFCTTLSQNLHGIVQVANNSNNDEYLVIQKLVEMRTILDNFLRAVAVQPMPRGLSITSPIAIINPITFEFVDCNAAHAKLLGRTAEELHGRTIFALTPPFAMPLIRSAMRCFASGKVLNGARPAAVRHSDGRDMYVRVSFQMMAGKKFAVSIIQDLIEKIPPCLQYSYEFHLGLKSTNDPPRYCENQDCVCKSINLPYATTMN